MLGIIILSICFFFIKEANAQNLVSNSGFEIFTFCPTGGGQINNATPWYNPTANSPDYYNGCSININASEPGNSIGYQYPHDGNAYAGICVIYGTPNGREYIEARLQDSLIKEKSYCVNFYISLAGGSNLASDGIGIYFSKDSISDYSSFYNFPYSPQVKNPDGNIIRDTSNWVLISGEFIAGGGEKFLTIGNFKDDATTNIDTVGGPWFTYSYYYIDDISVYLCDTTNDMESALFIPNTFTPNDDGKNDVFKAEGQNISKFNAIIFNRWGELLYEWEDIGKGWDGKYKGYHVPDGIYVYSIKATGSDGVEYDRRGTLLLSR